MGSTVKLYYIPDHSHFPPLRGYPIRSPYRVGRPHVGFARRASEKSRQARTKTRTLRNIHPILVAMARATTYRLLKTKGITSREKWSPKCHKRTAPYIF